MTEIISKPFDWNDNMAEIAQEDFSVIKKDLSYGVATTIGMALAKLELLEKQGCNVETQKSEEAHRWIPCEKRLPDKLQDVLVTFYDAEGEYDVAYMRKTFNASYKAQGCENEWVSSIGETTYADYEVVAWKPIEPYTAESEEA